MGSIGCLIYLSAIFPPKKLPIANPRSITPIIDVQVKIELPIKGAIILEAISSIVIKEKPVINDAKINKFLF